MPICISPGPNSDILIRIQEQKVLKVHVLGASRQAIWVDCNRHYFIVELIHIRV